MGAYERIDFTQPYYFGLYGMTFADIRALYLFAVQKCAYTMTHRDILYSKGENEEERNLNGISLTKFLQMYTENEDAFRVVAYFENWSVEIRPVTVKMAAEAFKYRKFDLQDKIRENKRIIFTFHGHVTEASFQEFLNELNSRFISLKKDTYAFRS